MQYISATDARADFAGLITKASMEPIVIQKQNRDVAVVISPQEYQKLRAINLQELDDLCARTGAYAASQGLTEEILAELLADKN